MRKRILIIDDDNNIRKLLKTNLDACGYETAEATCGKTALECFRKVRPDLVILDVMMPNIDGWEVCKIIKDNYPAVKVILLTARDSARDKLIGKEILKADWYMTKPFDIEELLEICSNVLGNL
jgi:two-component system response regulator VicR